MADLLPKVIDLNVGGKHFTTTRSTLTKYPDSMLAAMFSGRHVINQDKDGRFVIDCDGKIFCHILEFLRFGTLPPFDVAEAVYKYSEYFQLIELSESLCKFQPVSYSLQLSNFKERNAKYPPFANKVIELLSKNMARKNDNIVINVTQENTLCNKLDDYVRMELYRNIQPLLCLEVGLDFFGMGHSEMEEIFLLTAARLQTLGYGSSILHDIGFSGHKKIILICNDNVLSKLHKITRVRFTSLLDLSR